MQEKTQTWNDINFTKLLLKDNNIDIIYWDGTNWESETFCTDARSYTGVSPPICSYCKISHFNVNVWWHYWNSRGSFCLLRVPVPQNDCFMEVKLSVFRVHWVSAIALSHLPCEQSVQDFTMRCKQFWCCFYYLL